MKKASQSGKLNSSASAPKSTNSKSSPSDAVVLEVLSALFPAEVQSLSTAGYSIAEVKEIIQCLFRRNSSTAARALFRYFDSEVLEKKISAASARIVFLANLGLSPNKIRNWKSLHEIEKDVFEQLTQARFPNGQAKKTTVKNTKTPKRRSAQVVHPIPIDLMVKICKKYLLLSDNSAKQNFLTKVLTSVSIVALRRLFPKKKTAK